MDCIDNELTEEYNVIVITDPLSIRQNEKGGMNSPNWRVPAFHIRLTGCCGYRLLSGTCWSREKRPGRQAGGAGKATTHRQEVKD